MKLITIASVVTLTGSVLLASQVAQPQSMTVKEEKPGLLKRAKITPANARTSALAKVPGGTIQTVDIEEEKGKLIYSFDIKQNAKSGVEEVAVDAMSGSVVSVVHESPATEAKEAAKSTSAMAKTSTNKAAATKSTAAGRPDSMKMHMTKTRPDSMKMHMTKTRPDSMKTHMSKTRPDTMRSRMSKTRPDTSKTA